MATGATVRLLMAKQAVSILATDGAPDLRAMLDLARNTTASGRRALFASINDLFLEEDVELSERERTLMGDILRKLVGEVEMAVRKELAQRLAERRDAPHNLVVALANDEIEVAHPLLVHSEVLKDADLIELVRDRTRAHQLSIATRKTVSEEVSQALADTEDTDVIATLLQNGEATISRSLMAHLVVESKRIDKFQKPLVSRRDMPPELAQKMYWWVSAAMRHHIVNTFDIDPEAVDDSVELAVKGVLEQDDALPKSSSDAQRFARNMAERGRLTEDFLLKILRQGEVSLFEACFAEAAKLEVGMARRLLYEAGGEGLAFACRASGFERDTFLGIFELTRKGISAQQSIDPRQITEAGDFFDWLELDHAKAVVKRWRRNPNYLRALDEIENHDAGNARGDA